MPKVKSKKMPVPSKWTYDGDKVLILRRCKPDGSSSHGFVWPKSGRVECPDWNAKRECGGGLHGWPWGMGLGEGQDYDIIGDLWIVFAALPSDVVGELPGDSSGGEGWKCKARCGDIVYAGPFAGAWAMVNSGRHRFIEALGKSGAPNTASGDSSTAASSGNYSKAASSGKSSKAASSGDSSTAASSGDYSKAASSGKSSTAASSGDSSTAASSGDYSKAASSGDYSTAASSGDSSTAASSGYYSKAASSGDYSKAQATGKDTIAMVAGFNGFASAGEGGMVALPWKSIDGKRKGIAVGIVGEGGILADTKYRADETGKLVVA